MEAKRKKLLINNLNIIHVLYQQDMNITKAVHLGFLNSLLRINDCMQVDALPLEILTLTA